MGVWLRVWDLVWGLGGGVLVTQSPVCFIVIAPLLSSHCDFSFVFGCGVSFLVISSVFLSMIVQQLVVIPVPSQEGVSAHPSTLPS